MNIYTTLAVFGGTLGAFFIFAFAISLENYKKHKVFTWFSGATFFISVAIFAVGVGGLS